MIFSGGHLIDKAPEAIEYLRSKGKSLYFVTNTSGRTQQGMKEKFERMGIKIEPKEAISSGLTTAMYLTHEHPDIKKVYVIGEQGLVDQLQEKGIECVGGPAETEITMTPEEYENYELDEDIGAVVVGYDLNMHYRKTCIATLYLHYGRKFIACNDDAFDMINGRPMPTTGVTLKTLEYTTHLVPYVCGKPNPHAFTLLCDEFNLKEDR